jgi:hypothetical protein
MAKGLKKLPVAGTSNATNGIEVSTKRSPDDEARERRYRAEDALRDIERAEKHRSDKALMKDVKVCAREKMKAYDKL